MPHISKTKMKRKEKERILSRFSKYFSQLKGDTAGDFLEEMLTDTEKIMLAKRLAIITMLIDGISVYMISETLKVSPSTVFRFETKLEEGFFSSTVSIFANKVRRENFLQDFEDFIKIFGIRGYGKSRYAILNRMYSKQRRIEKYTR